MVEQICLNEALIESAKEIFETMIFMDIVETTEPNPDANNWSLLSSITFKGGLDGCLAICCGTPCAQAIAINMLALDTPEELTEEGTCDAIGEVANMIMGGVKSRILKSVGNIEVSIPSVVSGHELRNNLGDNAKKISIKVNIDDKYTAELMLMYRENSI